MKKILIGIMIFLSFATNVRAEMISIDELIEGIKTTQLYEFLYSDVDLINDIENKAVKLTDGTESISFSYTEEYLFHENRDFIVTEENYEDDLPYMMLAFTMIAGNIKANGYDEDTALKVIENITENISEINYEMYGVEFETEDYAYNGTTEDGGEWNVSGKIIKYFKLSLDKSKVTKLVEDYGTTTEDNEENNNNYNLQPTVSVSNITENKVTISPKVEGYQGEEYPKCLIYRSDSEDGEYELISEWRVNCDGTVGIVDENLEEGKTYYYKARLEDGYKLSEAVSATTLSGTTNDKIEEEITENVKTGDILITIVWIIGIGALGYSVYSYRKQIG